ncbi:hypothetical protein LCGC14_2877690 [marine sediment metagenome]|uniref:Uncharacterized protein n=1 Tax=marine sediment metagenome TaxID=412755 RepID=A0A0F8Y191_9ZZZZ
MKSKDKQIRELESGWFTRNILWIFVIVILLVGVIDLRVDKNELESQLQSCQEKVPVWTLRVECYEEDIKLTFEQNFSSYEEYNEFSETIRTQEYKLFENCEVLSP